MRLNRRSWLLAMGASLAACTERPTPAAPTAPAPSPDQPPAPSLDPPPAPDPPPSAEPLAALEASLGGRVGVFARDPATGATLAHRADERFAMCSTFKWALAAAVLARVDVGALSLSSEVSFTEKDLLEYAPAARARVAEGRMTIEQLAEAAVTLSDNTAANLLLDRVEGPEGLTRFLRSHGDAVTRLDRTEPTLNENRQGDPRDTTTPRAMAATLEAIALGSVLKDESRERLVGWMKGCLTCDQRLWAGLPQGWHAGTKTGTCQRGAANDVGLVWPPSRGPIVVASYLSDSDKPLSELSAAQAAIGRIVVAHFG